MINRLIQLDGMRGIAILLVVLFHYTTRYEQIYGHPGQLLFNVPLGRYGVQLFFITSGFVIFMTLERTSDYRNFIISRFARLYPSYWISVVLTATVVWLFSLPGRQTSLQATLVNLTMFQEWLHVPHVDGVYWTLTLELSFYVIIFVLFTMRLLPKIEVVATGWLCTMMAVYIAGYFFALQIPEIVITSLLLDYAHFFMAGIMFYKLYLLDGRWSIKIIIVAASVIEFIINGLESGLVCLFFFILFGLAVSKSKLANSILTAKPLVYLGTISYTLYLLHQNIGYVILRTLYTNNVKSMIAIPIAIATSLMLAASVSALVEIPAKEAIRAYWKKIDTRTTENKQGQNT